jgi:branched-chain amino acid aminotransferase
VGPYFKEGFNPISVWVSQDFSRAGSGGTGAAKAGGNYGGSLLAAKLAAQKGYSQVLWLDAKEHRFVEEGGAMNIFFIINNKLVTPPLGGTILPGITRKSLLEMAGDMGIEAEERPLDIHDIAEGIASGDVTESFAAGTAAVISPVGTICLEGKDYVINNNQTGPWALKFFDTLTGIQRGDIEDSRNWTYRIT